MASVNIVKCLIQNQESVWFIGDYANHLYEIVNDTRLKFIETKITDENIYPSIESFLSLAQFDNVHILFMWSGDLLNYDWSQLDALLKSWNSDFSVITNGSRILRGWPNSEQESQFIQTMNRISSCQTIWIWDPAAKVCTFSQKVKWLPEYHQATLPGNRAFVRQFSLGFYGALSIERGLGDFLLLALLNPALRFRVRGYGKLTWKSWRPRNYVNKFHNPLKFLYGTIISILFLCLLRLPNVDFRQTYFKDDDALLYDIRQNTAVFYAADRHPYSSGISLLSLAGGVPVIWIKGNSAASDNLSVRFAEGQVARKNIFFPGRLTRDLRTITEHKILETDVWQDLRNAFRSAHTHENF